VKKITLLSLLFITCNLGFSATRTFCGASGGNWNVASNWCSGTPPVSGTLPGAGDDVIIPAGITVVLNTNVGTVRSVTVNGVLDFNSNGKLTADVFYVNPTTGSTDGDTSNDQLRAGGTTYSCNGIDAIVKGVVHGTLPSPFPVKLANFNTNQINSSIFLSWKTKEETNFSGFEIHKSYDSKSFESIGFVSGTGEGNYVFSDNSPKSGNNYYRLKMIDKDGSSEFSKIISQFFRSEFTDILVYPNPVENKTFEIKIQNEFTDFQIFNLSGKRINAEIQKNLDSSSIIIKDKIENQSLILKANVNGNIISQKIFVN
jgi:hypothetical protein